MFQSCSPIDSYHKRAIEQGTLSPVMLKSKSTEPADVSMCEVRIRGDTDNWDYISSLNGSSFI
jgi:hypothetical protein